MSESPLSQDAMLDAVGRVEARLAAIERQTATALTPDAAHQSAPFDLFRVLSERAVERSADVVTAQMPQAIICMDHASFLKLCLDRASPDGLHCEFGVFSGNTINFCAELRPDVTFHGFDSFEGLPETWDGHVLVDFNRQKQGPPVRANVALHVGWFDDTLPDFAAEVETVSFLHVDCDIYSSTVTIFSHLGPKLRAGSVVVFDEYFCYPGFELHEMKAFEEFLAGSALRPRWLAVCGPRAGCILE